MVNFFRSNREKGSSVSPVVTTTEAAAQHRARQEQFLTLYSPLSDSLARFCHAMTNDIDEARDLISETVLRAFQSFEKIREPKAFQSYLFTIASRLHHKQQARQRWWTPLKEEDFDLYSHDGTAAETTMDIGILYTALQALPEKQREAIVLYEISGFSMEEIRLLQGGSLSGVKSRVARARDTLKSILEPQGPTSGKETATPAQTNSSAEDDHYSFLAFTLEGKV